MNATLHNWSIVSPESANPYTAPELITQHLNGDVSGHHAFEDGKNITTSPIRDCDVKPDGTILVATKSGSKYELGEPAASYEAAFPGAKQRLIESIK